MAGVEFADAVQVETLAVSRHLQIACGVLVTQPTPADGSVDPLLASLAVVFERLGKLTLGSAHLADHGIWLSYQETKGYSHELGKLCADARGRILTSTPNRRPTNPAAVAMALSAADADPFLTTLIDVLRSYGAGGRYDRLDYLTGHLSTHRSTVELWQDLEAQVRVLDPTVENEPPPPFVGPHPWRLATTAAVARSTAVWVAMIRSAWLQGAAGPAAKGAAQHLTSPAGWPTSNL